MRQLAFHTLALMWGLTIAVVALSVHPAQAAGEITYVDDDAACPGLGTIDRPYCTIQGGVDNASAGDTVQVAPGVYYESINMKGGVVIQGAGAGDDPSLHSIIDGEGKGVVVFAFRVDSAAKLDGFTITHGFSLQGGGMANVDSSHTVSNCIFSGNVSDGPGGGMYNSASSPTVTHCTFFGNSATRKGGGMYNIYSSPTVTHCSFSGNSVTNAGAKGGGMFNEHSSPSVTNCTFSGNVSDGPGGGIYSVGSASPKVIHCTFSANSASDGGGMFNDSLSSPTVTNCIMWGDTPQEIYSIDSSAAVTYSDVQAADPLETYPGEGNINADPLFVDPDGLDNIAGNEDDDYHLQIGSPCIDKGTSNGAPEKDIEGNLRPQGRGHDLGAYEFPSGRPAAMPWILLLLLEDQPVDSGEVR